MGSLSSCHASTRVRCLASISLSYMDKELGDNNFLWQVDLLCALAMCGKASTSYPRCYILSNHLPHRRESQFLVSSAKTKVLAPTDMYHTFTAHISQNIRTLLLKKKRFSGWGQVGQGLHLKPNRIDKITSRFERLRIKNKEKIDLILV